SMGDWRNGDCRIRRDRSLVMLVINCISLSSENSAKVSMVASVSCLVIVLFLDLITCPIWPATCCPATRTPKEGCCFLSPRVVFSILIRPMNFLVIVSRSAVCSLFVRRDSCLHGP
ncbi:hypothetical protein PMAYCL1PPCAC_23324, partial [Pristionchus mayeri]